MSGSLPQSKILAAADGSALVRATVRGAARQPFSRVFRGFARQFNAVFHNHPHHRR